MYKGRIRISLLDTYVAGIPSTSFSITDDHSPIIIHLPYVFYLIISYRS